MEGSAAPSREDQLARLRAEALASLEVEERAERAGSPKRAARGSLYKLKAARQAASSSSLAETWEESDRPHIAPKPAHQLVVIVEHCTAPRPFRSLKGSKEKYAEVCGKLEQHFQQQFEDAWQGRTAFQTNTHPRSKPDLFMEEKKAIRFLEDFSYHVHQHIKAGTKVLDLSAYPPQLQTYPRIGSLEVSYSLREEGEEVARGDIFSKLATQKWPNVERLVARLQACVQGDLWRLHKQELHEAELAARSAAEQQDAAADAAERAQLEREQVEVARAQVEALRQEMLAAEGEGDAAAAAEARQRLGALERRLEKEVAEAEEATRRAHQLAEEARLAQQIRTQEPVDAGTELGEEHRTDAAPGVAPAASAAAEAPAQEEAEARAARLSALANEMAREKLEERARLEAEAAAAIENGGLLESSRDSRR